MGQISMVYSLQPMKSYYSMGNDANDFCLHLVVYFVQDMKVCCVVSGELCKCDENILEEDIQSYLLVEGSLLSLNKEDLAKVSGCFFLFMFSLPTDSEHP